MARAARRTVATPGTKNSGRQGMAKRKEEPYSPQNPEDDPYRDLRMPDDEGSDPVNDEYIWPEFEEEDEDRV